MKHIRINADANQTMEIVREMRKSGMVQGEDFDFEYCPSVWDDLTDGIPNHALFIFYKEKYATMFALRWS
jgi:hypothetical protein